MKNIKEIENTINIRRPLLYLDKVLNLEKGKKATCVKMFSYNENFFQGHFQGNPVVPGTILIECMIQSVKLLCFNEFTFDDQMFYSCKIPIVNFKKSVTPGDQMIIESTILEENLFLHGQVKCFVENNEVCNLKINLINNKNKH